MSWFLLHIAVAATLEVEVSPAAGQFATVQDAINVAEDGDQIAIGPGTFRGTVAVWKPLTLRGAGMNATVLVGDDTLVVIEVFTTGVVIEDLTVDAEHQGGGIDVLQDASLTASRLKLRDSAGYSALTAQRSAEATLQSTIFCGNEGGWQIGGAIYVYPSASVTAQQDLFYDNSCYLDGGAIHVDGDALLTNNTFIANEAPAGSAVAANGTVGWVNNLVIHHTTGPESPDGYMAEAVEAHGGDYLFGPALYYANDPGDTQVELPGDVFGQDPGLVAPLDCATVTLADVALPAGSSAIGTADGTRGLFDDFGAVDFDRDGDGHGEPDDCDDDDPTRHPGVDEACDGIDNNCDGGVDEGVLVTWWPDADGDGFGDRTAPRQEACEPPGEDVVDNDGDCDDTTARRAPDQPEVPCDGLDNDCDEGTEDDVDCDPTTGTQPTVDDMSPSDATATGDTERLAPACAQGPATTATPLGAWLRRRR